MRIGGIDPYDIAIRVDLGEIREEDLPKVFSGDAKKLAECKRYLYQLRSDKILYREMALRVLTQKLEYATDPKTVAAALNQTLNALKENLITNLRTTDAKGRSHPSFTSVGITNYTFNNDRVEYDIYRTNKDLSEEAQAIKNWNPEKDIILHIENASSGSNIIPMKGWNRLIDKKTFDKVVNTIQATDAINVNILKTAERRSAAIDILENETIPFISKMWGIGILGDILEMFGKALGGNL